MKTESYKFMIIDLSDIPEKQKLEMKKYEIWTRNIPIQAPQMLAQIEASSFKIACCIYEHQSSIDSLKERMERNDSYIEDAHFGSWYYNPKTNSNSWTGRYFESKEEALKSFNI